ANRLRPTSCSRNSALPSKTSSRRLKSCWRTERGDSVDDFGHPPYVTPPSVGGKPAQRFSTGRTDEDPMANARPYRIALNGYGRIGRCVLRAFYERGAAFGFEIVALNDLADMASLEYLTRFDSTHGRFPGEVGVDGDCLHINGDCVKVLRESTPEAIDWRALGVDLVLECSGAYNTRAGGQRFLAAGVPRVLFSQPMASASDIDATVVMGINHEQLNGAETLVSNASCTTNCGVPLLKLLNDAVGIDYASITTIHSAMNDQPVIDAYHHDDLRRTRSAFQSVIPVSTGL